MRTVLLLTVLVFLMTLFVSGCRQRDADEGEWVIFSLGKAKVVFPGDGEKK